MARARVARVMDIVLTSLVPLLCLSSLRASLRVSRRSVVVLAEVGEVADELLSPRSLCIISPPPVVGVRLLLLYHEWETITENHFSRLPCFSHLAYSVHWVCSLFRLGLWFQMRMLLSRV